MKDLLASRPQKILVRSTNWIGDAIMTTPAIRTIRQNFPEAEITLLALPWVIDVFATSPHIDNFIVYEKKTIHSGIKGRYKLIKHIAARHFDLAILLQNAFEAALVATLARVSRRAGYSTDGRRFLLTDPVRLKDVTKRKHQVHYYQEMLQHLGLVTGPDTLFLEIPENVKQWAFAFTRGLTESIGKTDSIIGINPGASYGPAKRWPARKYAHFAQRILRETASIIIVFGTESDREAASEIKQQEPDRIVDLTGSTSLAQAMALIKLCTVFITNDSGLMHVAAALRTPTVAIFGSTNPVTTGPFSQESTIIRKEISCSPCMKTHCRTDFKCMQ